MKEQDLIDKFVFLIKQNLIGRNFLAKKIDQTSYKGKIYSYFVGNDPSLINEIEMFSIENGIKNPIVRICFPDQAQTCDYIPNRINIHLEKIKDDTFKILSIDIG